MRQRVVAAAIPLLVCGAVVCAQAQVQPDHAVTRIYNRSLGVECTHCHSENDFANASKATFDFAKRMQRMVRGINEGPLKNMTGITCWSCHRGRPVPPRIPRAEWESIADAHATDFAGGREGLALAMSVYSASLGIDCSHCHVAGAWTDTSKPPRRMVQLMSSIFELIPIYFDQTQRMPRTQCFMCHQGRVRVERAAPPEKPQ